MKLYQQISKVIVTVALTVSMLMLNTESTLAQERNSVYDRVIHEYQEKKAAGIEVYELLDENGRMLGFYEPYSKTNPKPDSEITPAYTSYINWTIGAGLYNYGVNQYTLSSGMKIQVTISQSVTGTSYLTFHNRDTNSSLRFNKTKTTDGWNGTVTLADIDTAVYSFGIENASSQSITYTGNYTL